MWEKFREWKPKLNTDIPNTIDDQGVIDLDLKYTKSTLTDLSMMAEDANEKGRIEDALKLYLDKLEILKKARHDVERVLDLNQQNGKTISDELVDFQLFTTKEIVDTQEKIKKLKEGENKFANEVKEGIEVKKEDELVKKINDNLKKLKYFRDQLIIGELSIVRENENQLVDDDGKYKIYFTDHIMLGGYEETESMDGVYSNKEVVEKIMEYIGGDEQKIEELLEEDFYYFD